MALLRGQVSLQSLLMQLVVLAQGGVFLEENHNYKGQKDKLTHPLRKRIIGGRQEDLRLGEFTPASVLQVMIIGQVPGHTIHV